MQNSPLYGSILESQVKKPTAVWVYVINFTTGDRST
jgi:hypothetical protein